MPYLYLIYESTLRITREIKKYFEVNVKEDSAWKLVRWNKVLSRGKQSFKCKKRRKC